MKFRQLIAPAVLAACSGLFASTSALAATCATGTTFSGGCFVIADELDLDAAGGMQDFAFDVNSATFFSLTISADSSDSVTSFSLYEVGSGPWVLQTSSIDPFVGPEFITLAFDKLRAGSYVASVTGTGLVSVYGSVGTPITAVPEPETYGLALAGLLIAGVSLRRRAATAA